MKVRCIKKYYDLEMERAVAELEEYEVSEARAKELSTVNNKSGHILVEIIEKAKKPAPKKSGRPKKEAK